MVTQELFDKIKKEASAVEASLAELDSLLYKANPTLWEKWKAKWSHVYERPSLTDMVKSIEKNVGVSYVDTKNCKIFVSRS